MEIVGEKIPSLARLMVVIWYIKWNALPKTFDQKFANSDWDIVWMIYINSVT